MPLLFACSCFCPFPLPVSFHSFCLVMNSFPIPFIFLFIHKLNIRSLFYFLSVIPLCNYAAGWTSERSWFASRQGQEAFISCTTSRPALGPTHPRHLVLERPSSGRQHNSHKPNAAICPQEPGGGGDYDVIPTGCNERASKRSERRVTKSCLL